MKTRYLIALSFGMKIGILFFSFSLLYAPKLIGQNYFNPSLSADGYKEAVQYAKNLDVRNNGITGLMQAAMNGEIVLAKLLVKNGAHLNLKSDTKDGQTALHFGVARIQNASSREVAYYLIKSYADTRIKNNLKQTPLHLVVNSTLGDDRTAMATALIKNGADINAQDSQGNTLIHVAVGLLLTDWLKQVLEMYGPLIDLSIKNNKGLVAEKFAQELGFLDLAKMLKETPPSSLPKADQYGPVGLTGLQLAIMRGDQKQIKKLLANKKAVNMKSKDEYQNTPLHIALLYENGIAADMLLESGASPLIKNGRGAVPANFLVRVGNSKLRIKIAASLIRKSPQAIMSQDKKGENLLHYIVRMDDQPLLSFLLRNYKDIVKKAMNVKNVLLQTPLELAQQMRRSKIGGQLQGLRVFGFQIG